ncbi:uncharacterized protein LOC108098873 [Drosophila ficusphila]|uniref:uncharacterized protein LOC108098873 n=1 Tax=Drosophila ficusphila TaxID=30025 RepID=UPI001C89DD99|nr:uncharacterized protein LOC108098873 [Drosophila ficusphila]
MDKENKVLEGSNKKKTRRLCKNCKKRKSKGNGKTRTKQAKKLYNLEEILNKESNTRTKQTKEVYNLEEILNKESNTRTKQTKEVYNLEELLKDDIFIDTTEEAIKHLTALEEFALLNGYFEVHKVLMRAKRVIALPPDDEDFELNELLKKKKPQDEQKNNK